MFIAIIEQPRLTIGPANVIGVKEHESVHFKCHFNASLIPHLALCGWLKDGHNATNGNEWNTTESGFENHLICGFDIDNVSMADEGTYSCYCYYSESFREQFHFDEIASRFGEAVLQFEISKIIVLASSYTSNFIYIYDAILYRRKTSLIFCAISFFCYSCYFHFIHDFASD